MARAPKYDMTRMEPHPPRVPEPYSIIQGIDGFLLKYDGEIIRELLSESEDGAHREAMVLLKELDF